MRRHQIWVGLLFAALATPGLADGANPGDPARGEKLFKQCQACHVVRNDAGEVLAGRTAKTGPNLYKLAGRPAGAVPGYPYSPALDAAGAAGVVWDAARFAAFVANPEAFLRQVLGDPKARGKMRFRVKAAQDAADLYAFLAGLD